MDEFYETWIISQQNHYLKKSNNPTSPPNSALNLLETSIDENLTIIHTGGCLDKYISWN